MNYKDLIGVDNPDFEALASVPKLLDTKYTNMVMDGNYLTLFIYQIIADKNGNKAVCSVGKNGVKELYNIKTIDGEDWLYLNNEKVISFKDVAPNLYTIGEIKNDKVYCEYFNQGYIYKNELVFLKTLNMSDSEIDKLPLKDKICYIPESTFDTNEFIDLNSNDLKDGIDYYTVKSILESMKDHFGEKVMDQIDENHRIAMIKDVFDTVDWQSVSTLIEGDEYLDNYVEEVIGISLEEESDCEL